MALVEPLVGHLLSKHADFVKEGLQKIQRGAEQSKAFATSFLLHRDGFHALQELLKNQEYCPLVLRTVTRLVETCDNAGVRSSTLRDMCRGKSFWIIRTALASLSDETLPTSIAAIEFMAVVAMWVPKVVLARFENNVPFHLAAFRLQLPYSQRRIRLVRAHFLINLVASPYATAVETVVCKHGYLTHLLEDAAELLQEGTEAGLKVAQASLRVLRKQFMEGDILSNEKRAVLLGQKNIMRLLVKALDFSPVSEYAADILYRIAVELVESPSDYKVMRMESEDRGMPNYLLFFILRHLRPKTSSVCARLVTFILHQAPDLIRPYFTRISGHLRDDGHEGPVASATATVATLNVMTRAMLAPVPYHLSSGKAKLQTIDAKAITFFSLNAQHICEEVCPAWVAEYVHRVINGSTDLLMLSFAMQLTHAALVRAKTVQRLVRKIQDTQQCDADDYDDDNTGEQQQQQQQQDGEEWETFDAKVQAAFLKTLPRREEFWHRMTQQLHPLMIRGVHENTKNGNEKLAFLSQRMILLMELYSDVFRLRVSWLSAVPSYLPTFRASVNPITDALCRGESILATWPAPSVSALCSLLVSTLSQGVSMIKLHHVTMSGASGGVMEWPLLLNIMLWAVKHPNPIDTEGQIALAWIARLVQWTVHSVTVRFMCELEEAFLWLTFLNESTLPCFVHLINNLLQRNLSRTANRVAEELMQGSSGVLVAASSPFIAKAKEKLTENNKSSNEKEACNQPPVNGKKNGPEKGGRSRTTKEELSKEFWTDDMRENLKAFEAVVHQVEQDWPMRANRMQKALPTLFRTMLSNHTEGEKEEEMESYGKRRIALTKLQTETEHRALRPHHEQLLEFCRTLRPPMTTTSTEESELLSALSCVANMSEMPQVLSHICRPSQWCRYSTVGFYLASTILTRLEKAVGDEAQQCALTELVRSLLREVSNDAEAVVTTLLEQRRAEDSDIGFFVFLLAATRTLLNERRWLKTFTSNSPPNISFDRKAARNIAGLLMRTYGGTISTADRIRYATLLTMHYLQQDGAHSQLQRSTSEGHEMEEGDGDAPVDEVESEGSVGTSDKEDQKNVDVTLPSISNAQLSESKQQQQQQQQQRKQQHKMATASVFSGALVPSDVMIRRFLIMDHQNTPHITPEVDMLSLLVDTWTDDEVVLSSLQCPARLHNSILVGGSFGASDGWNLMRSVFPELSTNDDVPLASFEALTSSAVMDPRYLVPLLHTVLAMPEEQLPRKNIGTKCIPMLLKSLSFLDANLRRMGSAALAAVWTPSAPIRIVIGFARLKLSQLAAKKERPDSHKSHPSQRSKAEEWRCPRLPTPLSVFLVLALKPLGDAGHPLHNDMVRFLLHIPESFSTPVPLSSFLTTFPLGCITTPVMIQRNEAAQQAEGRGSIAAVSALEVVEQLRAEAPVQLNFILRLIQHSCQTNGDIMALIHSYSLQNIMMLASMVAVSSEIRLQLLRCLHDVCVTSAAVAYQAVEESHVLSWLLGFAYQLTREYGEAVHLYGEPLFMQTLQLLRKLCPMAPPLQAQQTRQQVEHIRTALAANCVTTKAALDGIDEIARAVAEKRYHGGHLAGQTSMKKRFASSNRLSHNTKRRRI